MPTVRSCRVSPGNQRIIRCRSASPPQSADSPHGKGKLSESDRCLKDGKRPASYCVSPGEYCIIRSHSPPCTAASSASGSRHIKATDPPSAKRAWKSFQLDTRRVPDAPALHDATRSPHRISFSPLPSKNNFPTHPHGRRYCSLTGR